MSPQLINFIQQIGSKEYKQGDVIFREGDLPDDTMYFLFSGEVAFLKNRPEGPREINRQGPGTFFGEMALVGNRARLATGIIATPTARLAVLNKDMFLKLAGSSPQFLFNLLKYAVSRLLAAEDKLHNVKEELQKVTGSRGF